MDSDPIGSLTSSCPVLSGLMFFFSSSESGYLMVFKYIDNSELDAHV